MFTLTIKTSNAAFGDTPEEAAQEIARMLRGLANDVEFDDVRLGEVQALLDINGNVVGTCVQD